jgi:hypothetical protein
MVNFSALDKIRHDIISIEQSFKSYHDLLGNQQINISHKKLAEILHKCCGRCRELNSLLLNGVKEEQ